MTVELTVIHVVRFGDRLVNWRLRLARSSVRSLLMWSSLPHACAQKWEARFAQHGLASLISVKSLKRTTVQVIIITNETVAPWPIVPDTVELPSWKVIPPLRAIP